MFKGTNFRRRNVPNECHAIQLISACSADAEYKPLNEQTQASHSCDEAKKGDYVYSWFVSMLFADHSGHMVYGMNCLRSL
jgi:hypothetical protein